MMPPFPPANRSLGIPAQAAVFVLATARGVVRALACHTPLQLAQTLGRLFLPRHPGNCMGHGKNYV